jgi:hypothetical protein
MTQPQETVSGTIRTQHAGCLVTAPPNQASGNHPLCRAARDVTAILAYPAAVKGACVLQGPTLGVRVWMWCAAALLCLWCCMRP